MPGDARWRPPRPLVVAGLALFATLGLLLFDPRLFGGGDNVVYYLLGKALAAGRGYVTLYEPGEPPHSLYPPGYPAMLVPIFWLFGGSLWAAKALSFLAACVSLALAARYLALRLDPRVARRGAFAVALLLLAANPTFLAYSHWTLSEMPFLALGLGALILAERGRGGTRVWLGAALLAAAAYLVRTAALPLCLGVAWGVWRGHGARAGASALGICLAAAGGWELRNHLVAPDQPGYLSQFLMVNSYYPAMGSLTVASFFERVLENLQVYALLEIPRLVWPFMPPLGLEPEPTLAGYLLGAVLLPIMLFGFVRQVRARGVRAGEVYTVLYGGMLLAWQWQGDRFLLPLLPLLLSYLGVGLTELARPVAGREPAAAALAGRRRLAAAAFLALMLSPHLVHALRAVPGQLAVTARHLRGDRLYGYEPLLRDYFAASAWLAGNSPPDAVVVARKPQFTYLFSSRKSVLYPFAPPEEIERAIRAAGARYVVYDRLGNSATVYLLPYLLSRPDDEYAVVHEEGRPATLVLSRSRQ